MTTNALPNWAREFFDLFNAGAAHGFILCGDTGGSTVQGMPQRRFLEYVLLKAGWELVARYDRASGISFSGGPLFTQELVRPPNNTSSESLSEEARAVLRRAAATRLLGGVSPASPAVGGSAALTAALSASGLGVQPSGDPFSDARRPLDALVLLERLARVREARGKVAAIIEYADLLCPPQDKGMVSPDDRTLLVKLLSWAEDENLSRCDNPLFLVARNPFDLHPDLRAGGYKQIEIPLPTREERAAYLAWYAEKRDEQSKPIALVDITLDELANLTAGLTLRDVEDILLLSARSGGVSRALVKTRKDALVSAQYSEVAEMIDPLPGGFANLGGMEPLVAWARDEVIGPLAQGRRDVPKGVLLVGPPGTGKTYYVRALAREVGFNAVMLRAENILGGIVGESEKKLKRFFAFARALAPVLVFVDELDQSDLSRRGNGSGNPVAANLFNQMLQFMSDESLRGQTLVVFASNRPDLIDPALLRFGRVDAIIPVLLPDEAARRDITRAQAIGQDTAIEEEAVALIARQSENYSAADIAAVVAKALKLARRAGCERIAQADAGQALSLIRPATPQIAEYYTLLAIQACNDAELLPPRYQQLLSDRAQLQDQLSAAASAPSAPPAPRDGRRERGW